ncbi:hypothetical protein AGMMS49950_08010 [Endomicrobiia bacterium]|nr:hypothetical protein AGMMS49950_08010 [Endomicrobiia bacterium]
MYAVVRLLHHAGQRGIVDKNLWKKSNQELRNILADRIISDPEGLPNYHGNENELERIKRVREPQKRLSTWDIATLLGALNPDLYTKYYAYKDLESNYKA